MNLQRKKVNPWWVATIAGMASYLDAAAIVSTGTALVLYQDALGLSSHAIGHYSALLTLGIAAGAIVGGRMGDRFGRRHVFTVTMILYALAAAGMVFAGGPGILYALIPALGFAVGADLPVSLAMISEEAPPSHKGKMITFSHLLWMGGMLAAMGIGAVVGNMGRTGGQILYAHLAIVAVIVLILRATLPESQAWVQAHSGKGSVEPQKMQLRELFTGRYLLPLIGTGLFYALANVAANTNGQFSTYICVNVAGSTVRTASLVGLIGVGVSVVATFFLMRFVDTKYRMPLFAGAGVLAIAAWSLPIIFGFQPWVLITLAIVYAIGGAIAGEPMWKVWSQELFPTLLRSTAQGITTAFTRIVAAVVALWTPVILDAGPRVLYIFIVVLQIIAVLIGVFWLGRTRKAPDFIAPTEGAVRKDS